MAGLMYRPDVDEARARLNDLVEWRDIGRPAMQIRVPRAKPLEDIPALPRHRAGSPITPSPISPTASTSRPAPA